MGQKKEPRELAVELAESGWKLRAIAAELGVGKSTVARWITGQTKTGRDNPFVREKKRATKAVPLSDADIPEGMDGIILLSRKMLTKMHRIIETDDAGKLPYSPGQIKALLGLLVDIDKREKEIYDRVAAEVAQEIAKLCEGIPERPLQKLKERLTDYAASHT